jgi:hypothetical protein
MWEKLLAERICARLTESLLIKTQTLDVDSDLAAAGRSCFSWPTAMAMVCVVVVMVSVILKDERIGDLIYNTTTAVALLLISLSFYNSVKLMYNQIVTLPREQRGILCKKLARFRCAIMSTAVLFNLRLLAWLMFSKTKGKWPQDNSSPYWDCYFEHHGPLELFFLEWLGLILPSFILLYISSNVDGQAVLKTYADAYVDDMDDEEVHSSRFLSYRDSSAHRDSEYDQGRGRGVSYAPKPWGIASRDSGVGVDRESRGWI